MCAAVECHIVVARGAVEVNARRSHSGVVLWIEGVVIRNDIATADAVEWDVIALDTLADVLDTISECRELLLVPYLRVGNDDETVVGVILCLLLKGEVICVVALGNLLPELRNTRLALYAIASRGSV